MERPPPVPHSILYLLGLELTFPGIILTLISFLLGFLYGEHVGFEHAVRGQLRLGADEHANEQRAPGEQRAPVDEQRAREEQRAPENEQRVLADPYPVLPDPEPRQPQADEQIQPSAQTKKFPLQFSNLGDLARADLNDDFSTLITAVRKLASALNKHIKEHSIRARNIHNLSAHRSLIEKVSKEFWASDQHRVPLLQGAIWSILLETIFSNPFAVFGKRARHLGQEWAPEDHDEQSEAWRILTTEQLLIRCGVAQCGFSRRQYPEKKTSSQHLRPLFEETQSLWHTQTDMINRLIDESPEEMEWDSALSIVNNVFRNADPIARDAIHEARAEFTCSLKMLTDRFRAGSRLLDKIQEVVTRAQLLAIHLPIHRDFVQFIVPKRGDTSDPTHHSFTSFPALEQHGKIEYTVHPGLKRYLNANTKITYVIHEAEVFVTSLPGHPIASGGSLRTNVPPTPPISPGPDTVASDPYLAGIKSVSDQYRELREEVISFAKSLDTHPATHPQLLLALAKADIDANSPWTQWDQPLRNQYIRESVIWCVLSEVFDTLLYLFKNYDNRYAMLKLLHTKPNMESWRLDEKDEFRWHAARQLVRRLGGETILKFPGEPWNILDKKLYSTIVAKCTDMRERLARPLLGNSADQSLERLDLIVKRAMFLSMTMSVHKRSYRLWPLKLTVPYKEIILDGVPRVELTPECAHLRVGRIVFIVRPSLIERPYKVDGVVRSKQCYTPGLISIFQPPPPTEPVPPRGAVPQNGSAPPGGLSPPNSSGPIVYQPSIVEVDADVNEL